MKKSSVRLSRIMFLAASVASVSVRADTWTWTSTNNNLTWSSANWTTPGGAATVYPTGAGSVADFGQVTVGNARTVGIDLDVTVGSILMNSPYGWSLSRASTHASNVATITIDNSGAGGLVSLGGGGGAFNQSSTLGNSSSTQYLRLVLADSLTIRTSTASAATYTIHTPISGTGNLVVQANSAGATLFSAFSGLNHAGSVTNSGAGTGVVTINAVIGANVTGVTQNSATSKLVLGGANTYTGATTVAAGTLELGAADRIADASRLVLAGGTFATAGFGETLGTLSLTGNSTIDLGAGASSLVFAASGGEAWGGSFSLSIINYTAGSDSVRFGVDANGLTFDQLGRITINGEAVSMDDNGYLAIASVPEPSGFALVAGFGSLVLGFLGRRRG